MRIIKVKILNGSEELSDIAELCRKGRNGAIENWLMRKRGMPNLPKQREDVTESTRLYHAVTSLAPSLDTQVASKIGGEIASYLSGKVDWRFQQNGKPKKKRGDAILEYEQRPPWSQALSIPVHNKSATLLYGAQTSLRVKLLRGRTLELQLNISGFDAKTKRKLVAISTGEEKLKDSLILYKLEKDAWYWYVPLEDEPQQLDREEVLHLWPTMPAEDDTAKQDRPFYVLEADERPWYVGEGRFVLSQVNRLIMAEKEIGHAYRNRRTGAGHGRKKKDKAIQRKRIQRRHVIEEFRRRVICDIIKQADRAQAGTIVWHDPTLPLRQHSWFAHHELDWDWTRFLTDLKNRAARHGLTLRKERYAMAQYKESRSDRPHSRNGNGVLTAPMASSSTA